MYSDVLFIDRIIIGPTSEISSVIFRNLRKMFGNLCLAFGIISESSEIFGKWLEIFGKSAKTSLLRLLPTFAGALREKNCTLASFNKTPTNYISEESLINVLYETNTISAMFSFRNSQEAVRRETTEGSSIEFIGYRIPPYEQNGCTVLFPRHQSTKVCQAFSIF